MSVAVKSIKEQPVNVEFNINSMKFSALEWGRPGQLPVLALHGWLDNAASFFRVAPLLSNMHIVAVDMAGHGQTDHRLGASAYHCFDDISDMFSIADYFGWEKFALLGHSRGAIFSALAAGTFPDRISHVAMVEGFLLEGVPPEKSPQQLASAIKGLSYQINKTLSVYPDIKTAIEVRERGLFPLSHEAAKAITERGLKENNGGYSWSTDPRLLAPTPVKLTTEQFSSFINNITAPCELILGKNGLQKTYPSYLKEVANFPFVKTHLLDGGHHLHMEDDAQQVATIINRFLSN